jgi:hypothetical protein
MKQLIESRGNFKKSLMLLDLDDTPATHLPTKANMISAFKWVLDVEPGSNVFIHYSGHGGSVKDKTGKESDGCNETLCNLDYPQVGELVDDELNKLLVKPAVENGIHLFMITDSCHSGSNCDERFCMKEKSTGTVQIPNKPQQHQVNPQIPGMQQMQQMIPQIPGMQQMQQMIPQIPGMQQMIPGMQQMIQHPQIPGMQQMQQMIPQMPQIPQPPHGMQQNFVQQIGGYLQNINANYLIFKGKLYNSMQFYKRHVKYLEDAFEVVQEYNEKRRRNAEIAEIPDHFRGKYDRELRRDLKDLSQEMNELRKLARTDPYIDYMLKTNTLALPQAEPVDGTQSTANYLERSYVNNEIRQQNRSNKMLQRSMSDAYGVRYQIPQIPYISSAPPMESVAVRSFRNVAPDSRVQLSNQVRLAAPSLMYAAPQFNQVRCSAPSLKYVVSNVNAANIQYTDYNMPTTRDVSKTRKAYATRSFEASWESAEDLNMPQYSGEGTFYKLSGCMDAQTSSDGYEGRANGAMTGAVLTIFNTIQKDEHITIGEFLFRIRHMLSEKNIEQIPQFGSNKEIDPGQIIPL